MSVKVKTNRPQFTAQRVDSNPVEVYAGGLSIGSSSSFPSGGGQRKVSLLGASVTANNGNSSEIANAGSGGPSGWLDYGIVTWANMIMGQPMNIVANASHGGYTSSQILALVPIAIAPQPAYVIGHDWWINDIVTGVSMATSQTNILATIAACNTAGATVILTDFAAVPAETTVAMKVQHAQMVSWLDSIQGPGFMFIPIMDAVVDITTGTYLSWATYDGTHPSVMGSHVMGERFADSIKYLFPNPSLQPRGTNSYAAGVIGGSPYELMGNPMITGTPVSGVAPNFTIGGTASAVGSVVQATDFTNLNWQRVTLGVDGYVNLIPALVTGAGLTYGSTTVVPGTDKIRMQFEWRMPAVSAIGKWACVTAREYFTPNVSNIYALQDTNINGTDQGLVPDDNQVFLAKSPAGLVPTGTTSISSVITIYGLAGAVIDVRRVSIAIVP